MVAEHSGARSPDILVTNLPSPTMAAAASTPGAHQYLRLGILDKPLPGFTDEQFVEVEVGETLLKIGVAGAVLLLGADVVNESLEVIAEKLTKYFGTYQNPNVANQLAIEDTSAIESIEGTFDINEESSPKKTLQFDSEGIAAKSVPYKIAEVEARMSTQTTKTAEDKNKERVYKRNIRNTKGRAYEDDGSTTRRVQTREASNGKEVAGANPIQYGDGNTTTTERDTIRRFIRTINGQIADRPTNTEQPRNRFLARQQFRTRNNAGNDGTPVKKKTDGNSYGNPRHGLE